MYHNPPGKHILNDADDVGLKGVAKMFKARWRSDRNKIKAVFKLQFEATQIPQSGWEALMVSLVPPDSTRPTAKSEKAVVVNGACCWEKAIFETVRLSREPKSGKINEKVYRFLISATESPKARILGEANLDFGEYAEVTKPSPVSLSLKASNSNPILHVKIQRIQDDVDGRESEENGVSQQITLPNQLSNCDNDSNKTFSMSESFNSIEDGALHNSQAKFPTNKTVALHIESNGNLMRSRSFDASSASETDNGSEQYTPKLIDSQINNINKEQFLSPLRNSDISQKQASNPSNSVSDCGDHRRSITEYSITSAPDGSSDGSTNSSEDTGLRERLQGPDISFEKLRNEVVALARQLEVSELELQALRKQVVKERKQGEDLSKELHTLRDERDMLKRKCELLKASGLNIGLERVNSLQFDGEDLRPLIEEMKQELNHEKNLNATLHLQLQKTQESNSELILAVKDLEDLLEQKSRETQYHHCNQPSDKTAGNQNSLHKNCMSEFSSLSQHESGKELFETISEHDDDEELEELAKERDVNVEYSLEQQIKDLNAEIELYKKDRENIETQMEQLALDYEIIKQENHDLSSRLEQSEVREQLKMQYECSAHISIIGDLEAHVESLEKELEKQAEAFETDLANIISAKVEQEKRAIKAEEMLQKTKWNNVSTIDRLQEEFKMLSVQMSAAFNANEKLTMRTLTEASELRLQKTLLQESLEKAKEEMMSAKNQHKDQLHELLRQIDLKTEDANQLHLKFKSKCQELQNQKKSEDTMRKTFTKEISMLRVAMEKISEEKSEVSEQVKQGHYLLTMVEQDSREKDALDTQLASVRKEAERSMEELCNLRHLKKEKDVIITTLSAELEILKDELKLKDVALDALKQSYSQREMESGENIGKLEQGVSELGLKDSQPCEDVAEVNKSRNSKNPGRENKGRENILQSDTKEIKSVSNGNIKASNLFIRTFHPNPEVPKTGHCNNDLLSEMATLKEKNESMEFELKEMQERYSEISLKFAEVEGERQQLVMTIRALKNAMKN